MEAADFVDRVSAETAGNPFFVEELMRALVEQGSVYLKEGHWAAAAAVGELDIPTSIRATLQRRLGALDRDARAVVELLAAAGRPVGLRLLVHATGLDGQGLHRALTGLEARRMVSLVSAGSAQEPRYGVCHDRLREAQYELAIAEMTPAESAGEIWLPGSFDCSVHTRSESSDKSTRLAPSCW